LGLQYIDTATDEVESFEVKVEGDAIAVTFIDTPFKVVYRKPPDQPHLAASGFSKEPNATQAQIAAFLSVAWRLANDKARRLGWIV